MLIYQIIISRFDFLFIVLDKPEPALDRHIAQKVLANHRYKDRAHESLLENDEEQYDDINDHEQEDENGDKATIVYQKFDKLLHLQGSTNISTQILSTAFLKKYIQFAKESFKPKLEPDTIQYISDSCTFKKYYKRRS